MSERVKAIGFTPGPWTVGERRGQTTRINALGGDPSLDYQSWRGLAEVYGCTEEPEIGGRVMAANARLIAAAPELYEALKQIAGVSRVADPVKGACDAVEIAEAALRHVEGQ